jgi:hypothetical protein
MDVFTFVLIIVIGAPLAKGIGNRIARSGSSADAGKLARIATELEATEHRLADTERRLQLAEERLDFQERLLTARPSRPADPPLR